MIGYDSLRNSLSKCRHIGYHEELVTAVVIETHVVHIIFLLYIFVVGRPG